MCREQKDNYFLFIHFYGILIRFLTVHIGITGDYILAWSSVYSQIVCKVCPQFFSECMQDTEIIFCMYLAYTLYLMPIEFVVNWLMLN